jgi:Plasmid pRiA4b ORF-3-like protein
MHVAGTVPAFDLRISIEDTEPQIWRRLRVPAALTVREFHLAVQAAFGWEDRHLYAVRCVDPGGRPRVVTTPDDETDDLGAEADSAVVLSDLLDPQQPGSVFKYEYDFGDGWTHQVVLLGPAELAYGGLQCLDGANRGPVEDSGGPHGYARLVQILADRQHPEHGDAERWVYETTGEFGQRFDATRFDLAAANRRLRILSLQWWPQPLTDAERDAVTRPVRWFLENAAGDGMELTKDGYLKPVLVARAVEEIGWDLGVLGKGNREANVLPVRELREHVLAWKLVRKLKGRLVLTPRGRRALEQPGDLWDYLVDAIANPKHEAVRLTMRLYTNWYLSGIAPPRIQETAIIRLALEDAGFVARSGHRIPEDWVTDIYRSVLWSLMCLHLFHGGDHLFDRRVLADGGVKFFMAVREAERRVR